MQFLDEVSFELENLFFVTILLFSLFFDKFLFEDSGLWICINHEYVALIIKENGLRKIYFPVFLKNSFFHEDFVELAAGKYGIFFPELRYWVQLKPLCQFISHRIELYDFQPFWFQSYLIGWRHCCRRMYGYLMQTSFCFSISFDGKLCRRKKVIVLGFKLIIWIISAFTSEPTLIYGSDKTLIILLFFALRRWCSF